MVTAPESRMRSCVIGPADPEFRAFDDEPVSTEEVLMAHETRAGATKFRTCLGVTAALLFCFAASAVRAESDGGDLFNETIISETLERVPSVSELRPEEVAQLHAAKDVVTKFFQRLSRTPGTSPLELLTLRIRGQYADSQEFFLKHFDSEAIVSYRIFDFVPDFGRGTVTFRIFLRQTMEGTDYIEQREVLLTQSDGGWQIDELR